MAITFQNAAMQKGEDRTLSLTATDSAGASVDMTGGGTVSWVLRSHVLSTTAVLTVAGSSLGDGTFSVVLADTDTDSLNPGVYYHEAKYTDSGDAETVVAMGMLELKASVT